MRPLLAHPDTHFLLQRYHPISSEYSVWLARCPLYTLDARIKDMRCRCRENLRLDVLETCFVPLLIRCEVLITFIDDSSTKSATTVLVVKRNKLSCEDQLQVGQQYSAFRGNLRDRLRTCHHCGGCRQSQRLRRERSKVHQDS